MDSVDAEIVGLLLAATITKILIVSTVVIWIVWDIVAVLVWGRSATESWRITQWARRFAWVPFALGYVCGHWIGFTL